MDPYVLVFSHKHPSCSGQSLFSVQLASIRYITPYVSLFWRSVSPSLQQASVGSLRGLIRTTLLFIARIPIIIIFFSLYLQISYIGSNDGHSRGRFIFQLGGGAGTHKTTQEENGIKNGRQRRERGLCNASTGRRDKEKAKQIQESGAQRKKARRGKKKGLLEETYGVKMRWMAPCSSSMAPSKSPHEDMGSDA